MAIRLINRPSVTLQEPESGLDVFLKEVARYASPEYQLRRKESERADARLELSRRQQQQVEERYEDSLRQQQFSNDLASKQEDRLQRAATINEENNLRTRADKTFTNATSGFGVQELINTPTEAFLADITDPKERMLVERRVNSLKTKAGAQRNSIMKFKDDYNKRNPDNEISDNTAMVLFGDPEEHAKHLSRVYLDRDAGKMNDFQKGQVDFFTKQIGRMSKRLTDLETREASLEGADFSLQKEELQLGLDNAYSRIEKILNISSQGGDEGNPYSGGVVNPYSEVDAKIEEFKKNPAEVLARTFNTQNVNEDDYDILFADDNEIGENVLAQIQANQNATDDSDVSVLSGSDIDRYDPTSEELDDDSAIPPAFLQRAGEGMARADAETLRPDTTPPSADAEMAGDAPADIGDILEMFGQEDLSNLPTVPSRPGAPRISVNYAPSSPSGLIEIKQGEDKGDNVNVQQLSSKVSNSLKKLESTKKAYRATDSEKETNKKGILARRIASEQKKIIDLLQPYLLESGDFRDNFFNQRFYDLLSKRTKIPVNELKGLILSNMEYNI